MALRLALRLLVGIVGLAVVAVGLATAVGSIALAVEWDVPEPAPLFGPSIVLDRTGRPIYRFKAEVERQEKPLAEISPYLQDAVVATEDHRFGEHRGVDALSVVRAVVTNVQTGEVRQGGSTLTQQYVKNVYVGTERSLWRKVREALVAVQLEKDLSKEQILEAYLNRAYFGEGAYGAEAAALTYFDKPATQVNLAEAALIASTLSAPTRASPLNDPAGAVGRRNAVLDEMAEYGFATPGEVNAAKAAPLGVITRAEGVPAAPFIIEEARRQLLDAFGPEVLYKGGLTITLTIDLERQFELERQMIPHLPGDPDFDFGMAVVDPRTGDLVAAWAGRDFVRSQVDLAFGSGSIGRQSGSTFKPVVLATAIEEGFSLGSRFPAPSSVTIDGYTVQGGGCGGVCSLREATADSVNSVFVQLGDEVGVEDFTDMAHRLGVRSPLDLSQGGLSFALGTAPVTPLDLASAFGTFANDGVACPARVVLDVRGPDGAQLPAPDPRQPTAEERERWRRRLLDMGYDLGDEDLGRCYRAVAPSVARTVTSALREVVASGTGTRARIGRPVAGKTGTSQRAKDLWFAGYTPDLAGATFYGYIPSEIAMRGYGGTFVAPIWADAMAALLAATPPSDFPTDIPDDRTLTVQRREGPADSDDEGSEGADAPAARSAPNAPASASPSTEPSASAEPSPSPEPEPTATVYDGPPVQPPPSTPPVTEAPPEPPPLPGGGAASEPPTDQGGGGQPGDPPPPAPPTPG